MKFWSRAVMAAAVALAMSAVAASAASSPVPSPKPSAPRNLKATQGDQQVTLNWTAPATGAPITGYTVNGSPGGYSAQETTTTHTVTGLTNGTLYTFTVYATNSVGDGAKATVKATPHSTPPTAPNNLSAIQGPGAGQYTLSWTPPTSSGSAPAGSTATIANYTVTVNPGGVRDQVGATTTTYVASNLADNITYTFNVAATNSRSLTGPPATVYAPLPSAATIGLDPTAGGSTTSITATGQNFLKNESLTLYWDTSAHGVAAVVTDDNGAFTKVVTPFAGDKPAVHKLCASVQPKPCASFTLHGAPTPTPTPPASPTDISPSSSPTNTSQASGVRPGGGGISGLDIITRPPFVFLPIIGILGLLGVLAYWLLSGRGRRRPMAPTPAATVTHMATRPDIAPFPPTTQPSAWPPAGAPSVPTPQHPAGQAAWEQPVQGPPPQPQIPPTAPLPPPAAPQPAPPQLPVAPPPTAAPPASVQWPQPPAPPAVPPSAPVEPPEPPTWPSAPDEPPDLPEPSD